VRLDTAKAARFSTSAPSTAWFERPLGSLARSTIAEDAQKSEPSLTITGNPGNVD